LSRYDDDSRPLEGSENIETLSLADIIATYQRRNIGVVHGDRYTWVHGWSTTSGGVLLNDCYGDEIPGSYGQRGVKVRAVVSNHPST
jgi:hypothetical protein